MLGIRTMHVGRARKTTGDGWAFTRSCKNRGRTLRIVVVGPYALSYVRGK